MRIAIDASSAVRQDMSGVAHYIKKLIDGLSEIDKENTYYICYRLSRLKNKKYFLKCPSPNFKRKLIQEPFNLFFSKKIDLFHGPDCRLPRWENMKKVVTIHDLFSLMSDKFATQEFRKKKIERYKEVTQSADIIITDSYDTKNNIVSLLGVDESKVEVVYYGVDSTAYYPHQSGQMGNIELRKVKKKYNIVGEYLFFVGVLSDRKNIKNLIEAFKIVLKKWKGLSLILAGNIHEASRETVEVIEAIKPEDKVNLIGYVESCDLPYLYSDAKIFVFPSLMEGFGIPILEAFASGVPVVTSNLSSMPEVAGDAARLVDPYNPQDIADGVLELLGNHMLCNSLRDKGIKRAKEFSWKKTAKETLDIYKKVFNM